MYNYFIINPAAGRIQHEEIISILNDILKKEKYEYKVTEHVLHARQLAFEAAKKHEEIRIYSIGGDGTLNEVANGIVSSGNKKAIMIPVPLGSGNDFVRSLGYKVEPDIKTLLEKAINCKYTEIDICKANERYFINISSLGFDATVVANAIRYKKNKFIPKGIAYYLSVLTSFIRMKSYLVNIIIDENVVIDRRITLTAIANGKYYGGGIIPVPLADLRDGYLDLCIVDRINRLRVPVFLPKYAKGEHGSLKEVSFKRCKKLHIISKEGNIKLNIDGEISCTNDVLFEVCDHKLLVGSY